MLNNPSVCVYSVQRKVYILYETIEQSKIVRIEKQNEHRIRERHSERRPVDDLEQIFAHAFIVAQSANEPNGAEWQVLDEKGDHYDCELGLRIQVEQA